MKYTSKEIFDFMRKTSLKQSQVDSFYELLEQGAELNTIASFLGLSDKSTSTENKQEVKVSNYKLSERSLKSLEGVDPNLVKIVKRAIELTEQDFVVIEGVRSKEQMMVNYGKGRTVAQLSVHGIPASYAKPKESKVTWLNNPFSSKHGKGKAVDIVPYPVDWNDVKKFDAIAKAMFSAAKELGCNSLRWGADWDDDGKFREKGETDSPHFEL